MKPDRNDALTRDAIKCWAAIEGDKEENCTPGKQNLVWLICAWVDHDGVNKYAHQFADTLGVAQ